MTEGTLLTNLGTAVGGRRWSLVTSKFWLDRMLADKLGMGIGRDVGVIGNVPSNPTESVITGLPWDGIGDVVVAVGGGSVMDTAKALVAISAMNGNMDLFSDHLRQATKLPEDLDFASLICVPTTSGTGSEVTRWATIWGDDAIKYSLTDPRLYPEFAVLAPELSVTMPAEITVSSGLDAVSHAMESVWNRNHTPLSDQFATAALKILRAHLERCVRHGDDLEARQQVQRAATMAGQAMSITQTALCHSISYPFTALFGMPHGLACSFTLGAVCRYNLAAGPERLGPIAEGLAVQSIAELPGEIDAWLGRLDVGRYAGNYVGMADLAKLDENLITRSRARNNIRDVDGAAAKGLALQAMQTVCNDQAEESRGMAAI